MLKEASFRAAAYCRVSTANEHQQSSLSSQRKYFEKYIKSRGWTLFEIYSDDGITGTSAEKRHGFLKMMSDANAGKFDIIITKEISRFARNTLDSIYYTRKLSQMGIGVYFINDNLNTLDSDAELRLTIMSSIAQEESRRTSQRVKWGQTRKMEEGVVFGRSLLGYDLLKGKLYVNNDGAKLVRRIFRMYTHDQLGAHTIAKIFTLEGIPTYTGAKTWNAAVIRKILKNEKYIGILHQKKTVTDNYLTHHRTKNNGYEKEIIIENHHEAIIDRETFELANHIMQKRKSSPNTRHSTRYCFSGKLLCPVCGKKLVSRTKRRKDGSIYYAWKCCGPQIPNNTIVRAVSETISSLSNQDFIKLQKSCLNSFNKKKHQYEHKTTDYEKEFSKKRLRAAKLYADGSITKHEFAIIQKKLSSDYNLLKKHSMPLVNKEYMEEEILRNIVKSITVYNKHFIKIEFFMNVCATWKEQE